MYKIFINPIYTIAKKFVSFNKDLRYFLFFYMYCTILMIYLTKKYFKLSKIKAPTYKKGRGFLFLSLFVLFFLILFIIFQDSDRCFLGSVTAWVVDE